MRGLITYLHNVDKLVGKGADRNVAALERLKEDMPELWNKLPDEFSVLDDENITQFGQWLTKMTRGEQ